MWLGLWHALVWVPKLFFYGAQRLAVWTGTLYLFREGKYHKIYYFLSAVLYVTSWVLIILLIRETFKLHFMEWIKSPTLPRMSS